MAATSVINSALCGYLTKFIKVQNILFIMFFMSFANAVLMFLWEPVLNFSRLCLINEMCLIFGLINSINKSQLPAYVGICFPDNWSSWYSVYSSFESLGWILGMLLSYYDIFRLKYYFYLGLTTVGFTCFAILHSKRTFKSSETFKNEEKIRVIGYIFEVY